MDEKEKARVLGVTLGQIEKQFGKGAIMRLGSNAAVISNPYPQPLTPF